MSAHSFSNLEQWKSKQKARSSPLYQNVELLKGSADYPSVDALPLPPPPPPATYHSATSRSNQQIGNLSFPPPPPDVESYSYGSDINGNQFRGEHMLDRKQPDSLYANLPAHQSMGTRDHHFYQPIDRSSVGVPLVPFPQANLPSSARLGAPVSATQRPAHLFQGPNSRPSADSNGRNFVPNLKGGNTTKQLSDYQQDTAIYANLQASNPPPLGLTGFKSNAPIKNSLRVNRSSANKEGDEVDHLTDLLVKSMENSAEPDFFGMCNKCGEKVVGEGSGCTAMEMVYHIQCFTCFECHKELRGKSFYAMESNPFCEECYLNTLEKCCVCEKPILDRILRATGKPYHPSCFTCVVCKKSLDGIPFTVDASNQIHCIEDFHKKFAPRCSVCNDPIVPEPGKTETVRVVALDRSFHVSCYKCEDCDLLLSSEAEGRGCYPLDDHILCRGCNAKRVQEITAN